MSAEEYERYFECKKSDRPQKQDKTLKFEPISQKNIGYQMLCKLGWRQDQVIGKRQKLGDSHSLTQLFDIFVKVSRKGLG